MSTKVLFPPFRPRPQIESARRSQGHTNPQYEPSLKNSYRKLKTVTADTQTRPYHETTPHRLATRLYIHRFINLLRWKSQRVPVEKR